MGTIKTWWGKYKYYRLDMGICCSTDVENAYYSGFGSTCEEAIASLIINMRNNKCFDIKRKSRVDLSTAGVEYDRPYLKFKRYNISGNKYKCPVLLKESNGIIWAWII